MTIEPYAINVRLARFREEIKVRTFQRRGAIPTALQSTSMYRLKEACLNDVGYYYCARDDRACLCGFAGRGALGAHLRAVGTCIRCGQIHDSNPATTSHPFQPKTDENRAPHVLAWICRYHGPEVMRPSDADEPINADMHSIVTNQQWQEYMERLAQRGRVPRVDRMG